MDIKVLGTGCTKCMKLYDAVVEAVHASGVTAAVTKVEKIDDIMAYGILLMPGLVIDGKVVSSGKAPKAKELEAMITAAARG